MSIQPKCDVCLKKLERKGALAFAPPDENGNTTK